MPIYEYQCASCGHKKEVLQKMSDAPLTECPACGKAALTKLISAAGFQLKGSGWYATDFKGAPRSAASDKGKDDGGAKKADSKSGDEGKSGGEKKAESDSKPKEETKTEKPASSAAVSSTGQ